MAHARRRAALTAFKILNSVGMLLSLGVAATLSSIHLGNTSWAQFAETHLRLTNIGVLLASPFVWNAIFSLFALYSSDSLFARKGKLKEVAKATLTGTMLLLLTASLLPLTIVTPLFLVIFWTTSTITSAGARAWIRRRLIIKNRDASARRQILIVGTNERALELAWELHLKPELGYHLLGFVDKAWRVELGGAHPLYSLVAGFDTLPDYLRDHVVDEVILCLPLKSLYEQASQVVGICEEQGIPVTISTRLFEHTNPLSRPRQYQSALTLSVCASWIEDREMAGKRVMDVLLSCLLILLLSPLLLLIAAGIKLTSRGPVFFNQERVGQNKRLFVLYKFRTMIAGADEMQHELESLNEMVGSHFKIKNDPRITRLGKLLRRTSMDELPQLFNVLKGDMSIVGPRPLSLRDAARIENDWPRRRFSFKPGITCLWQVRGRNLIPFEQWMEMDMEYIDNWSLWLDLKILFWTIPAVLKCEGAY